LVRFQAAALSTTNQSCRMVLTHYPPPAAAYWLDKGLADHCRGLRLLSYHRFSVNNQQLSRLCGQKKLCEWLSFSRREPRPSLYGYTLGQVPWFVDRTPFQIRDMIGEQLQINVCDQRFEKTSVSYLEKKRWESRRTERRSLFYRPTTVLCDRRRLDDRTRRVEGRR